MKAIILGWTYTDLTAGRISPRAISNAHGEFHTRELEVGKLFSYLLLVSIFIR